MITVNLRQIAENAGIKTAYQLQNFTGFPPSQAARLWKGNWANANIKTLNTLCNLFKCSPNDILVFTPDPEEQI
jgi:DNA-binding Xre family transcriptional regulator